jgi:hypothetical protein
MLFESTVILNEITMIAQERGVAFHIAEFGVDTVDGQTVLSLDATGRTNVENYFASSTYRLGPEEWYQSLHSEERGVKRDASFLGPNTNSTMDKSGPILESIPVTEPVRNYPCFGFGSRMVPTMAREITCPDDRVGLLFEVPPSLRLGVGDRFSLENHVTFSATALEVCSTRGFIRYLSEIGFVERKLAVASLAGSHGGFWGETRPNERCWPMPFLISYPLRWGTYARGGHGPAG